MTGNDGEFVCEFLHFVHGFVGQPCQQSSEWSDIILGIAGDLAEGFSPDGGLGSLRLAGVGEVFRYPSE